MKTFSNVKFNGTFRDYQQNILNNADKHLKDGKIHIVAAPGSGKTILGLELINRLKSPALVLSPSVTIRQQWGERFKDNFISNEENSEDYVSYDLKQPKLITSVTYQALHAAFNKTTLKAEAENAEEAEEGAEKGKTEDFSGFDLVSQIKSAGVTTICLDEAHHLRSEWQKALEGFIKAMGSTIKTIALTATPPYDSTAGEWNKYSTLCGEIDEEIFVPQLVSQKTLCPHQDYIYFNYPTEEELKILSDYKEKAKACIEEIIKSGLISEALNASSLLTAYQSKEEFVLDNTNEFSALLSVAKYSGVSLPQGLVKLVLYKGSIPEYTTQNAETAFQFIIDNPEFFTEEVSEKFSGILLSNSLIDKKKVCLESNDQINKMLISSKGKLISINEIVKSECKNLGENLRMLILTDFIKKDMLSIVGTDAGISTMGTVPIFESVRRVCDINTKIAVLSGTLVIVPNAVLNQVAEIADSQNISYSVKPIPNTKHSNITFSGSNKNKVAILTEAFQRGYINILIGTKSLLGEGWDSPCINSLILASFVGSFMLSNQMRGRAIRTDKSNPDKASNIWHLVTIEPSLETYNTSQTSKSEKEIVSADFDTVKRRFECFLAPAYHNNFIESGIERIDIIKPPFNRQGIENINNQMLSISADRETMKSRWNNAVKGKAVPEITEVNEVPETSAPKGVKLKNILLLILVIAVLLIIIISGVTGVFVNNLFFKILSGIVFVVALIFGIKLLIGLNRFSSPQKSIKTLADCILKTLKDIGEITTRNTKVEVYSNSLNTNIMCSLSNATVHEKTVFANAVSEMLSPIDNPRYLLIKQPKKYTDSYACPSIIGTKKENAQIFADYLKKKELKYNIVYTRNESGRQDLIKCKKYSYINANAKFVKRKKVAK